VVDMACRVRADGRPEQTARVIDLSEGGASIADAPAIPAGASGSLALAAVGSPLPFTVRHAENGVLHVVFRLDEAGTLQLRSVLAGIATRRAA
jgi:hypothetical protein